MSTSSSESDSSSDSNSDDDSEVPGTNQSTRNAPSSSSSDSSSSSESDTSGSSSSGASSDNLNLPKKRSAIQSKARTSAGSSSSSSESKDELEETPALPVTLDPDVRASKKRRAGEDGAAVVTATTAKTPAGTARGGKASRKANTPFQRVNAHAVKYFDEKLKDNSFESRVCHGARGDDYGAKANRDLIVTRGDGFRKEKNKKKRGSYRGGDITLNSHSFKFED
ncbi:SRP40, C-terminal domain-containing protein [Russula brevipes]|nr:SRP40, C-terminal domain-containing protein [Russula brevipes]